MKPAIILLIIFLAVLGTNFAFADLDAKSNDNLDVEDKYTVKNVENHLNDEKSNEHPNVSKHVTMEGRAIGMLLFALLLAMAGIKYFKRE